MKPVIRERDLKTLEFKLIRERLASLTVTPMARTKALALLPSGDYAAVRLLLSETGEGRLLCARGAFSPPAVPDIEPMVLRADKGGVLDGAELAAVAVFLKGVTRWQRFMKSGEQDELYPVLARIVAGLDGCPALVRELAASIDEAGKVPDTASSLLADLRRKERALQERIRDRLDAYIRDAGTRRYLQEAIVTIRNGRYVLPVKLECRQRIDGVLHDQSASGATLFIEPLPVVQLQNQLTAVVNQAEREIERILSLLSARVADHSEALMQDRAIYAELDLITARGRLSLEQKGVEPALACGAEPRLHLVEARHPLLAGPVVPLTATLGGENRIMVVTGPNTGGKTVALKTIGLMAVMAQCGLHIPAGRESSLFVFDSIRADIGDEQSIVQSLSTFSAHLKNIISILAETGPASLVLLDELGAGTDPSEGAALAMAILAELSRAGSLAVATTHINELKVFAQVREKMQNAAMEFNHETLEPTYRLLQGVPGQSNAFVIAAGLGLPEAMLEEARGMLQREHAQMEDVIASLVEDQRRFSRDSRQAALERARAESLLEDLEREREKMHQEREEIMRLAREEARQMIRRAKHEVDGLIRELRQARVEKGGEALAQAEQARRTLHELRRETGPEAEIEEATLPPGEELAPGNPVLVKSLRQKGEILSLAGEEALVRVGPMKVHVPLHELRRVRETAAPRQPDAPGGYTVQKNLAVSSRVHVRGMTMDEALHTVEKFLDDALWAGLPSVTIIHGKGTGTLKAGLRKYLKGHSRVRGFRGGTAAEGGEGVTVAELTI